MLVYEKVLCEDGIVRYPARIVRSPKKVKKEEQADPKLLAFDELYQKLGEEYYGFKMRFHSKGFKSGAKKRSIQKIVQMVEDHELDMEIFLRAQFEAAKQFPRAIWPSHISSQSSLKTYANFVKKYPDQKSIGFYFKSPDLEEMLRKSHQTYLHYRDKLRLPEDVILRVRWKDFNPVYLLSVPSVLDTLNTHPEALDQAQREVLTILSGILQKDPVKAQKFWNLVRRVKC